MSVINGTLGISAECCRLTIKCNDPFCQFLVKSFLGHPMSVAQLLLC